MPGAGKTSVGRLLAPLLNLTFHDTDEEVVREAGRSVEQLFSSEGPQAFRLRERQAIARLIDAAPAIIATGGGAMVEEPTRQLLLQNTVTIWLQASPETLARRLKDAPPRPLLSGDDLPRKLAAMEAERRACYAEADLSLCTDHLTPGGAAARVVELLSRRSGP
jgi:shikimate kinase